MWEFIYWEFNVHSLCSCSTSLMSYSLNVIPMDLFCLSGISCRVIDYGQFSKHPTANTWSIYLCKSIFVRLRKRQYARKREKNMESMRVRELWFFSIEFMRLGIYLLYISASIRRATLFHCFLFSKSSSKYNLIDFVDFA